ncbi:hypothetical protein ACRALDRAFT_206837 [Sodiomyces alcalophilus JCM 7366]|uniref:uncharacterized protein n=1 Tax=Sodiomyces alcalophilus JCM 7366 TaxID=591952 RepID=UPI0039B4228C
MGKEEGRGTMDRTDVLVLFPLPFPFSFPFPLRPLSLINRFPSTIFFYQYLRTSFLPFSAATSSPVLAHPAATLSIVLPQIKEGKVRVAEEFIFDQCEGITAGITTPTTYMVWGGQAVILSVAVGRWLVYIGTFRLPSPGQPGH